VQEKPQDFLLPETSEEIDHQAPQLTPDDLTRLHGVGEKSAAVLAQVGIVTYAQLAKVSAQDVKTLLVESGNRITNPDNWPQQAGFAARGDWEGLANFLAQNAAA
jgi:large subunit ribosomal protein L21